jgi:hypothetical protein
LKESYERLQQEKNAAEREIQEKYEHEKKSLQSEIEDYKNKLFNAENHAQDMQRKVYSTESEHEKELALMEQKIEFLEKSI